MSVIDYLNAGRTKVPVALDHMTSRIKTYHILLLSLVLAASSIAYHHGGFFIGECYVYLPFHLSSKPLLSKIYDSRVLDLGLFRARELSYFFDYIDCKFISLCVHLGWPHFLSLTHYVFSILTGMILWHFATRELNLNQAIGALLVILFWTSPAVFLGGVYFRTGKIGVTLAIAALYLLLYKIMKADRGIHGYRVTPGILAAVLGISVAACLFDEEGIFMIATIIVFLLLWGGAFPTRNIWKLLGVFVVCLIFSALYRYTIAPFLTFHYNHYWPDLSFQRLPWPIFFAHPFFFLKEGALLHMDTLRFLMGDLPLPFALFLVVFLIPVIIILYSRDKEADPGKARLFLVASSGLVLTNIIFIIIMNAVMFLRHPPLVWPDVRRFYYWLPAVSILCMTLAVSLSYLLKRRLIRQWLLFLLLLAAVCGNIRALPHHLSILYNGHLQTYIQRAPLQLDELRITRRFPFEK